MVAPRQVPDPYTDVGDGEPEWSALQLPESKNSAATFASMLELAVNPPPEAGWKRPKVNENFSEAAQGEWLGNKNSDEWLYHSTDHLFFHLPSGSLWEQRDVASIDSKWPAHSYFRVDFRALQALSMFAATLESNLAPMAFAAWARYTKKKRNVSVVVHNQSDLDRKSEAPEKERAARPNEEDPRAAEEKEKNTSCNAAIDSKIMQSIAIAQARSFCVDAADGAIGGALSEAIDEQPIAPPPDLQAPLLQGQIDSSDAEDTDGVVKAARKRKTSCFFCFRSKPAAPPKQSKKDAKVAKETAARLAATAAAAKSIVDGPPAAPAQERHSPRIESTDVVTVRPKVMIDTKHTKQIKEFLEDVKSNPSRLTAHVERRRADKISDAHHLQAYVV